MNAFRTSILSDQMKWKKKYLPHITKEGFQNKQSFGHILPKANQEDNFYLSIRSDLFDKARGYLELNHIKPHTGIHNLLSSWALCANLYWPFNNPEGKKLLAEYLKAQTNLDIETIESLELEYEDIDPNLKPKYLLGEDDNGLRGSGQTSPDLAVIFKNRKGENGILLIESKFTEHSFYVCSGYKKQTSSERDPNHETKRCLTTKGILSSYYTDCHLNTWGRKYWELLSGDLDQNEFSSLKRCPMSTCCYQLFRQQALAKGFQKKYSVVASCVAMDERNSTLVNSGSRTGLKPFPEGWRRLFPGLYFFWFTHQSWFEFVKAHNNNGRWTDWIKYIDERYL